MPSRLASSFPDRLRRPALGLSLLACLWLTGCDLLGIEPASAIAARKEAENKAIGAGCRHAARSVERCFELNRRADKAAVFAGWKEMNDYMRENNIEAIPAPPEREPVDVANADAAGSDEKAAPAKGGGDEKAETPARSR